MKRLRPTDTSYYVTLQCPFCGFRAAWTRTQLTSRKWEYQCIQCCKLLKVQPFEVELVYGYIVKKRRKPIRRSKGNEELVQALVNLGYKTHEAKRVVASCPGEGSVEQRLEAILRSLV